MDWLCLAKILYHNVLFLNSCLTVISCILLHCILPLVIWILVRNFIILNWYWILLSISLLNFFYIVIRCRVQFLCSKWDFVKTKLPDCGSRNNRTHNNIWTLDNSFFSYTLCLKYACNKKTLIVDLKIKLNWCFVLYLANIL